jgi:hypothetical protein
MVIACSLVGAADILRNTGSYLQGYMCLNPKDHDQNHASCEILKSQMVVCWLMCVTLALIKP